VKYLKEIAVFLFVLYVTNNITKNLYINKINISQYKGIFGKNIFCVLFA